MKLNGNCIPFTHRWSKWSKNLPDYSGGYHQIATCLDCNRMIRRKSVSMVCAHITNSVEMNRELEQLRETK